MAGKRSRISPSRSLGNAGIALNRRPIRNQQQQRWESLLAQIAAAPPPNHSPPGIFTLCSMPPLPLDFPADPAHFLYRCCYCKNRLDHAKDIYMYGALTAFCTSECRDKQYEIDKKKGGKDMAEHEMYDLSMERMQGR